MTRRLSIAAVVIGLGLFVHGVSGFHGASDYGEHSLTWFGYSDVQRIEIVVGVVLFAAGRLWQQRP